MRNTLALTSVALVALALTLAAFALPADSNQQLLDAQYGAQASTYLASAPVIYDGLNWGPVPLYTIDLRPLVNETIDVAAADANTARGDSFVVSETEKALWAQAGSPTLTTTPTTTTVTQNVQTTTTSPSTPDATPAPAPAAPAPPDTTAAVTTTTTTTPATTTTTEIPSTNLAGTVYLTRQLSFSPTAPLAAALSKTIGLPVTFASAVRFTVHGKKVTVAQLRTLLRSSKPVRLTLTVRLHHLVVTSLQV